MENKTFENTSSIEKFFVVLILVVLFIGSVLIGYAMAKGTGVLLMGIFILLLGISNKLDSIIKKLKGNNIC